jgi:hypothetical protein
MDDTDIAATKFETVKAMKLIGTVKRCVPRHPRAGQGFLISCASCLQPVR